MKKLAKITIGLFTFALVLGSTLQVQAQCGKFTDSVAGEDAKSDYSTYRTYMKNVLDVATMDKMKQEDRDIAYEYWQKAYKVAPAADGNRPTVWRDGRIFYQHMMINEEDEAKRKEYFDIIMGLYDEEIGCFTKDKNDAVQLGRRAYDMFYGLGPKGKEIRTSYDDVLKVLESSVEKGGMDTEYLVFVPYATVVVYQFTNDKMDKLTARKIYQELNAIADHNVENHKTLGEYYGQAKASMNGTFATIENNIFDCDYFVEKIRPNYDPNNDDPDFLKESITVLKRQGCDSSNAFLAELEGKWEKYADEENKRRMDEFKANNPAYVAKDLYDAEDFKGAVAKYQEAIDAETDDAKKADYYFRMASIQGRKLGQYNVARTNAKKAAALKGSWGRPYMLIGDLYAKSSRNCGSDGYTRGLAVLAAIDKYSYAKSIDPEVAKEANKRIGSYSSSIPEKGDVFMRGKQDKTDKVPCWIGENVKVRYQ